MEHDYPGIEGLFVHPSATRRSIAGNGTIGLEILEDLPDVDADPRAVRRRRALLRDRRRAPALSPARPRLRLRGRDGGAASPRRSRRARRATIDVPAELRGRHRRAESMLPEMWPLAPRCSTARSSSTLAGSRRAPCASSPSATASSPKGAGAASVAAALTGEAGRARSSASSPAETSTRASSRRSWREAYRTDAPRV